MDRTIFPCWALHLPVLCEAEPGRIRRIENWGLFKTRGSLLPEPTIDDVLADLGTVGLDESAKAAYRREAYERFVTVAQERFGSDPEHLKHQCEEVSRQIDDLRWLIPRFQNGIRIGSHMKVDPCTGEGSCTKAGACLKAVQLLVMLHVKHQVFSDLIAHLNAGGDADSLRDEYKGDVRINTSTDNEAKPKTAESLEQRLPNIFEGRPKLLEHAGKIAKKYRDDPSGAPDQMNKFQAWIGSEGESQVKQLQRAIRQAGISERYMDGDPDSFCGLVERLVDEHYSQ